MILLVGVCGYKDSGKTTLCREILERLEARGVRTGYVKRTAEPVLSPVGTDSGGVLGDRGDAVLWGPDGIRYEAGPPEGDPRRWVGRFFADRDLVLLEGGKEIPVPKIWVRGPGHPVPEGIPGVLGVYDRTVPGDGVTLFGPDTLDHLVDRFEGMLPDRENRGCRVFVEGRPLPMKGFVAAFVRGGLLGMLRSLKGVELSQGWVSVGVRAEEDGGSKKTELG